MNHRPAEPFGARLRRALFDTVLPDPGGALPAFDDLDLSEFWRAFEARAPWTLRTALFASTWILAFFAPPLLGFRRPLTGLDPAGRSRFLARLRRVPGAEAGLEIVKLVACLAYFDQGSVQRVVRAPRTP